MQVYGVSWRDSYFLHGYTKRLRFTRLSQFDEDFARRPPAVFGFPFSQRPAKRQFMYSMGFHVLPSLRFSISGGLSSGEWIAGFLAFPIFFIFFFPRWSGVKSFSYYYRVLRYVTWKSSMFFRSIDFHQNVTLIILFLIICNLYALGNIYYTIYINLIHSQSTIIVPFLSNYLWKWITFTK